MPLAQQTTHGVTVATKRPGVAIPEIEVARGRLSVKDVHFGICTDTFDGVLDTSIPFENGLKGLGPRILDIKTAAECPTKTLSGISTAW